LVISVTCASLFLTAGNNPVQDREKILFYRQESLV